jgi:hypothetical protein
MVVHEAETGQRRGMRIDDLWNMAAPMELGEQVPAPIRGQFDIARNAFVYSWFVYEFAALAEQQCFAILEMALRQRLDPAAPANTTRSPGLDSLLKTAVKRGWLRRDDFLMPSIYRSGDAMCSLDLIPMFRNHLMHGNIHLLPQGTPDVMRLCADVMNKLFAGCSNGQKA